MKKYTRWIASLTAGVIAAAMSFQVLALSQVSFKVNKEMIQASGNTGILVLLRVQNQIKNCDDKQRYCFIYPTSKGMGSTGGASVWPGIEGVSVNTSSRPLHVTLSKNGQSEVTYVMKRFVASNDPDLLLRHDVFTCNFKFIHSGRVQGGLVTVKPDIYPVHDSRSVRRYNSRGDCQVNLQWHGKIPKVILTVGGIF